MCVVLNNAGRAHMGFYGPWPARCDFQLGLSRTSEAVLSDWVGTAVLFCSACVCGSALPATALLLSDRSGY